jgi:hypothetical protein
LSPALTSSSHALNCLVAGVFCVSLWPACRAPFSQSDDFSLRVAIAGSPPNSRGRLQPAQNACERKARSGHSATSEILDTYRSSPRQPVIRVLCFTRARANTWTSISRFSGLSVQLPKVSTSTRTAYTGSVAASLRICMNWTRTKRSFSVLRHAKSHVTKDCAKLLKPLGGEVAEWLNAAVC